MTVASRRGMPALASEMSEFSSEWLRESHILKSCMLAS